jgi:hypothetical protein
MKTKANTLYHSHWDNSLVSWTITPDQNDEKMKWWHKVQTLEDCRQYRHTYPSWKVDEWMRGRGYYELPGQAE